MIVECEGAIVPGLSWSRDEGARPEETKAAVWGVVDLAPLL
jgi:hypothetical protein